jgi:hypothetical protein
MGIYIPKSATAVQAQRMINEAIANEERSRGPLTRSFALPRVPFLKSRIVTRPPQSKSPVAQPGDEESVPHHSGRSHNTRRIVSTKSISSHSSVSTTESLYSVETPIMLPETSSGQYGWLPSPSLCRKWRHPHQRDKLLEFAEVCIKQNGKGPFVRCDIDRPMSS